MWPSCGSRVLWSYRLSPHITINSAERHRDPRRESPIRSSRSEEFRRSRPRCDLFMTGRWWRRPRSQPALGCARSKPRSESENCGEEKSKHALGKTIKKPSISSIISNCTRILVGTRAIRVAISKVFSVTPELRFWGVAPPMHCIYNWVSDVRLGPEQPPQNSGTPDQAAEQALLNDPIPIYEQDVEGERR